MKRRVVVAILVLAAALPLAGVVCAPTRPEPGATPANVARLRVGMSRDLVRSFTGEPEAVTVAPPGGETWRWGKEGGEPYNVVLRFDGAGRLESGGMYFPERYMIAVRPRKQALHERVLSWLGL